MKWKSGILCVLLLLILCGCRKAEPEKKESYDSLLFDTSFVHEIDIAIDEKDWQDLLENPSSKSRYSADITIDGETISDVSFGTKGNSSLLIPAADENNTRYPFKVNFGKNVKGQTYHGLDKMSLSNLFEDSTYMKDYLSYALFRRAGVDAPLVSHAVLKINGNYHGLYAVIEDIDKGFLKRNAYEQGVLYKPESDGIRLTSEDVRVILDGGPVPVGEAHGADLKYSDEKMESYADIFENAETSADQSDYERVIEALKALNENRDLEKYLDTKEIARYFAVQTFLLNYDSYIGPMLHNYYLYEKDGRLSMLPWDYNSAFGTFPALISKKDYENPTALINAGIDSPLHMTDKEERPMWKWIIENEEYLEKYHEAFADILSYFDSGEFEKEADRVHEMLKPYVEKDLNGPYPVERFEDGCKALKQFCFVRAESISKQLEGSLSRYSDKQNPIDRVDASFISLLDMRTE